MFVLAGILSGEEFYNRALPETYDEFLLRPSDQAGHAYGVFKLFAGNLNVAQFRIDFENSSESSSI